MSQRRDQNGRGYEVAHAFGRVVNVHARSTEAIKRSLRAGADVIYHCEYADEEALDMLEAAKDRILVAPTVSLFHTMLNDEASGSRRELGPDRPRGYGAFPRLLRMVRQRPIPGAGAHQRGIRHVIGGDYGFAWSRHGTNARDLGFFIQYFGYSPAEALHLRDAQMAAIPDDDGQARQDG